MANLNESLLDFMVLGNNIGERGGVVNLHKQYQSAFYFVGLVLAELTWIAISIVYYSDAYQVAIVLLGALVWVLAWSTIGLKKKYMFASQYLFWVQGCFHTLMFSLARMTSSHNFILCGSSTGIIFFIILELCSRKKVVASKFYLYLYIWYALIFYDNMKKMQYASKVDWTMMILLDSYCLMGIIVFCLLARGWRTYSKFGQWQLLVLLYPLSIILVACMAGSFPEAKFYFRWVWLTFLNHAVFIGLCCFLLKNKAILPIKIASSRLEDMRQRLYQVSDVFLSPQEDHIDNPRESMQGSPPLSDCLICYDLKSSLCFDECKHACVCTNCAVELLQRNRKQCLYCRKPSTYLLEIQRLEGTIFAINSRYRFKNG